MCDQLIFSIHDRLVLEFGNLELASLLLKPINFQKALRKFREKGLHPSPSISGESNLRVIKVELFVIISVLFFFMLRKEAQTLIDRSCFMLYEKLPVLKSVLRGPKKRTSFADSTLSLTAAELKSPM